MKKILLICICAVTFILHPASSAVPSGFLLYNQNAAATAQATAVTAQIDNPSSIFYNPAALNQLEGTQVSTGASIIIPRTKFKNAKTGKTTHMKNHTYIVPSAYLTHKINDSFTAGVGYFSHFGLTTDWDDNWEGKFISTFAELLSYSLNPVISWQVHPNLSLAFGFNVIYSEIRQKRALNPAPLQVEVGRADLDADGVGYGFNIGMLYKFKNDIKVGISYRSEIDIEHDGDIDFKALPLLQRFLPDGGVSVDIDLPPVLGIGLSKTFGDKWTVEYDLFWVGWSTYDELAADFDKSVPFFLNQVTAPIPRDYNDIIDHGVGVTCRVNQSVTLRWGFILDRSPVPDEALDPILPDADKYCFSSGVSIYKNNWNINLTYYGCLYEDVRTNRNLNGFNGKYESYTSILYLGVDCSF